MSSDDDDAPTSSKISALVKTPARSSQSLVRNVRNLPPSPAVVTDVIDRQTARFRSSVSHYYQKSKVTEATEYVRDTLSSALAIDLLALAVEVYGLQNQVIPWKKVGEIPATPYITKDRTVVQIPDLFVLLDTSFWAPASLWSFTSVFIPLAAAYFFNLSLKASHGSGHSTRRAAAASSATTQFDPLVYNVAKALIAYLVYGFHFQFGLSLYQHFTIETVRDSIPGGLTGVLTGAALGGLFSLYESILKK